MEIKVNQKVYYCLYLLGKGSDGYSYLARNGAKKYVVKRLHYEQNEFNVESKFRAELDDYHNLRACDIPVPELLDVDEEREIVVKEYIEGRPVSELIWQDRLPAWVLPQVEMIARRAKEGGLNLSYLPTNFVIQGEHLRYVDYECYPYTEERDFERCGRALFSKTKEFMEKVPVRVVVDFAVGRGHPVFDGLVYPVNCGSVQGIVSESGKMRLAYILGIHTPLDSFTGCVKGVLHFNGEQDDIWLVVPEHTAWTRRELAKEVSFIKPYIDYELEVL